MSRLLGSYKKNKIKRLWRKKYGVLICIYCHVITINKIENNHPLKTTIDHFIPRSKGGDDSYENLVIACYKCNSKKANNSPI